MGSCYFVDLPDPRNLGGWVMMGFFNTLEEAHAWLNEHVSPNMDPAVADFFITEYHDDDES